ncbi:spondin domain-containing protein [Enterovibrio sp. ZSDZ35]|uniref:Spondin domain-containing protein n=1 Tax=Enterovibrio qingdaonensis TaxID=2899818 RepID=A0ABT5QTR4_9GAMM|nr:spondin domain-containing protein [Enterovibrio sp. ZSDZ35]MDD1784098.1 spondin domain-containing protein [Enterovibrio sp. ZSDZ35]
MFRLSLVGLTALFLVGCPFQKEYTVTVENLTAAQPMSPVTLITHRKSFDLFEVGQPVSVALEKLAEGGDNSDVLNYRYNRRVEDTLSGAAPLLPGDSESFTVYVTHRKTRFLSVASMLVNTNDALVAEADIRINKLRPGQSMTVTLPVWDAGTEANTESASSIPGPAAGGAGFSAVRDDVNRIRIHPGVLSTDDGLETSALEYQHRFLNPGAKITIKRVW